MILKTYISLKLILFIIIFIYLLFTCKLYISNFKIPIKQNLIQDYNFFFRCKSKLGYKELTIHTELY